ncbi:MAG: glycoside hydrolase domain-containing protein [Pseudolabrys sp.]|jgi:hypothetical protein
MSLLSRRTFTKGLLASALVPGHTAIAQPNDAGSIAIIDTPHNAAKVAAKLAAQNVKVVVRFFARKTQPGLREKIMASDGNMTDGVREPTILIRNGLSIVSLYQYRNNDPAKFLKGLEDTGSAKAEVAADAKAALEQAKLVGQPEGSAIYFGVDFNVSGRPADAVLEYFRFIGQTVGNHYAIGVYGNGFVNRMLRDEKLVSYNWISASRSHEQTVDFYNGGQWHLFQNQVDRRWFGPPGKCANGLDVDTNLQNPKVSSIGAWGAEEVDGSRNQKIFDQRRFAIRTTSVVQESGGGSGQSCKSDNRVPRNANVRILDQAGGWSSVDVDEDGNADGRIKASDLTPSLATMPPWNPTS